MSYRAFKRLLGETSLERKCRFLLGGGILLLMTGSFWLYARQTEHLAYDQTATTGRLLVPAILAKIHVESSERRTSLEEFQRAAESNWPPRQAEYQYKIIKPKAQLPENKADSDQLAILRRFLNDPDLNEESRSLSSGKAFFYYGAVRAQSSCIQCHSREQEKAGVSRKSEAAHRPLVEREGDLMALIEVKLPTEAIEDGIHINRALLISTALVTALLIMAGSYLIIRYVIVKPVKHLKEVSDAISAGNMNVRSEIQTGDEFEDLSYAFNRMLRNLVSMQDGYRKLNADLDRKVDELARANMALYESYRLKSDFLATMSHELRTPMNSILGFSDVLLSSNGLNEKQAKWVQNIHSSGHQLLGLINDILDLAKIEAGKMEVRPEEIDLGELCKTQMDLVRALAEKKNIDLRCHCVHTGKESPREVRQDRVKLQRILANLLSNAVKFTPEGGRVSLEANVLSASAEQKPGAGGLSRDAELRRLAAVRRGPGQEGDELVLSVTDTGVGIAPEDQELIFEKFRQSGNPMTREQGGTGLGLSIVRELTKLLGGDITLESELGRGSTFTVRLPAMMPETRQIDFGLTLGDLPRRPLSPTKPVRQPNGAHSTSARDTASEDYL